MEYSPTSTTSSTKVGMCSTIAPPKPTAVASSGWVRRQSRTGITRSATTVAKGRHGTSGRKIASATAVTSRAPTRAQSRHTRAGGSGARGSARTERTKAANTSPA